MRKSEKDRHVVCMFSNRNNMIDIRHEAQAKIQHTDPHVIPWYKLHLFALLQESFNQFQIIVNDFLQTHFKMNNS